MFEVVIASSDLKQSGSLKRQVLFGTGVSALPTLCDPGPAVVGTRAQGIGKAEVGRRVAEPCGRMET